MKRFVQAVMIVVIPICLVILIACGHWMWKRTSKGEQYRQRQLYERWSSAESDKNEEGERGKRARELAAQLKEESYERWGKHPEKFSRLPGTASGYYDD